MFAKLMKGFKKEERLIFYQIKNKNIHDTD